MNIFRRALAEANEAVYAPAGWRIENAREEPQNEAYGAGVFELRGTAPEALTVRFRVAKVTPTKTGQFVSFWEKDAEGKNQAFSYEESPDLWVVHAVHPTLEPSGQFVFSKEALKKHGVLSGKTRKGKMAIRVYPDWDEVDSKQAAATQKWQGEYFARLDRDGPRRLYEQAGLPILEG